MIAGTSERALVQGQRADVIWRVNERTPLDNPLVVWQVHSGIVAVFAVPVLRGEPNGVGRHLFDLTDASVGAHDEERALFGAASRDGLSLFAVALSEVRASRLLRHALTVRHGGTTTRLSGLAARWLDHLTAFAPDDAEVLRLREEPCEGGAESILRQTTLASQRVLELLAANAAAENAREHAELGARTRRRQAMLTDAVASIRASLAPRSTNQRDGDRAANDSPSLRALIELGRALGQPIRCTRDDTSVEEIVRSSRMRSRRVVLSGEWWTQDSGPILARRSTDQEPVALLPLSPTQYALFDPESGSRTVVDAHVAETISPVATMLYVPFPEGALSPEVLVRSALRGRGRDVAVVLAAGLAATLLGMWVPQATAIIMDRAIPDGDTRALAEIGFALFFAAVGSGALQLVQALAVLRVESSADAALQASVFDRVLTLPPAFFRTFTSGDLITRVMSVRDMRRALGVATLRALVTGVLSFANIALLFYYSGTLALLALLVSVLSSAATVGFGLMALRLGAALDALTGEAFGLVVELINGIAKIRVSGAEQRAFRHWAKRSAKQVELRRKTQTVKDHLSLFNGILSPLSTAVLFVLGARLLVHPAGERAVLSTGAFLAFSSAYGSFLAGMAAVSNTALAVLQARVHWARAKPILDAAPEVDSSKADPGRLSGRVDLEHVSFRYRPDGPMTLNDVSLHVLPGECVALVGPSGSGKSTILRVLLGFEPIRTGRVLFDGQDLGGLDVEAVRRQLGVVLQNGKINAGSLLENISGARDISLDDAWQAARDAGLEADIKATMPMGLYTTISEGGTNLSGGQRQRLLIARALARRPAIIIFDEATSALDNKTQEFVTQSLERMRITRIVIAHRLSTIRRADRIYVIDGGRVVQTGTFDELVNAAGLFREFARAGHAER